MTEYQDVFAYITAQKDSYRTTHVALTNSKDWSMYEHIQRCKNVANAWYHTGKNDGKRPYNDIVSPVIDVAFRSEGFDVKDIVPFVNDAVNYYKSFLVQKYHPQWARKNQLDSFIDECVETSIIYDLVLVKDVKNVRPEVVDLTTIAFCDQTDVLAAPICLEHNFTVADLVKYKGKWDSGQIDLVIAKSDDQKNVPIAGDQKVKSSGQFVQVFELRGSLPAKWLDDKAEANTYADQMQIVVFKDDVNGNKAGITLFKGVDEPLSVNFKALKIDVVRSKGRACGKSLVERLFEPQVANNFATIKEKSLLENAINIYQSASDTIAGQKLSELKTNTIIKHEADKPISKVDSNLDNLVPLANQKITSENSARTLASASEASLGKNPVSGTPFALQSLIVQEGQGIHDYRQGKIATFFSDVLYPELILPYLVKDMNDGKSFSEELTFDELHQIAETIVDNAIETEIKNQILEGKNVTPDIRDALKQLKKEEFMKGGSRRFFEVVKGELKALPVDVFVNIKGKQRKMAENADKITNLIREVILNLPAFQQNPQLAKPLNELLEESGLSPINFGNLILPPMQPTAPAPTTPAPQPVNQPLPVAN